MKKLNQTTGISAKTMIKTILIYTVLTIVLLFAGIRIAGFLMNGTPKAKTETTAYASATATATVTPTAPAITPSPTPSASTSKGTITIGSSEINIRRTPSTSGELVTTAQANSTYTVYETTTNEGYTWYRVGEDEWIPDGGNWLTYHSN